MTFDETMFTICRLLAVVGLLVSLVEFPVGLALLLASLLLSVGGLFGFYEEKK